MSKRYALFIGRWQPFHKGHEWLIDRKRGQGVPVLIAVRHIPPDEHNPLESYDVCKLIRLRYAHDPNVEVILIPDIESVNWGRGVGYEPIEHEPPPAIHNISATQIRAQIAAGDDSWRAHVDTTIQARLKELLEC